MTDVVTCIVISVPYCLLVCFTPDVTVCVLRQERGRAVCCVWCVRLSGQGVGVSRTVWFDHSLSVAQVHSSVVSEGWCFCVVCTCVR